MALTIIEKPYETPQPVILDNIENNLRFVEISPNIEVIIEETKYYQSGLYDTNEDNKKLYGFDNFFNIYAISSDGRHFVTKEEKTLIFYRDGQIIKQYLLDELVTDLTKISNPLDFDSMGYYYWINKIKTDYESDYLYLETADNILYLFDFKTGEILASTSFSLDNHAATIVKQDGSESNIEQLHICDSIFRFMVETQDIDNLSFTGFLEQENKNEDSTFLVAFPFNEIEKIIRLEDKEPIFQVYFKNNPPLKIKPENTYQLCAVDKDKNSIKFTINEIKSITDLELIEYDALPGKQQQLTREQLDYYKKGESNSPWKKLDLDNINHLIIDYIFLNTAIEKGDIKYVRNMLKAGANANRKIFESYRRKNINFPLLITAASTGNIEIVKLLIEHGADINLTTSHGKENPLHMAVIKNNYELTDFLIEKGADINNRNHKDITPLYSAAENLYNETKRLRKKQKSKDGGDKDIDKAISETRKIIKLLLESGSDPNITGKKHNSSILYLMVSVSDAEIVQLLLNKGADLNINEGGAQKAVLHLATQMDNTEIVKILLSNGADPGIYDKLGKAPLHYAVSPDTVEIFLEAGVDPDLKDRSNSTLLEILTSKYNHKIYNNNAGNIAEILLKHGADPGYAASGRYTPFEHTLRWYNIDLTKLFIKYGADVNALSKDNDYPIHVAARGPTELLNLLLEAGADPNKKSKGRLSLTALQYLCFTGIGILPEKPGPGMSEENFNVQIKRREDQCTNVNILENLDDDPDATMEMCKKGNENRTPKWKSIYNYCKQQL